MQKWFCKIPFIVFRSNIFANWLWFCVLQRTMCIIYKKQLVDLRRNVSFTDSGSLQRGVHCNRISHMMRPQANANFS